MVCIKDLHSQQFALAKPLFTAVRQVLTMEVHKPQCQLTLEDHRSFEPHLVRKQQPSFQTPQKRSDENELLLW